MTEHLTFASVDEAGLNALLSGQRPDAGYPWHGRQPYSRVSKGSFGLLYKELGDSRFVQPLALIAHEEEHRRLFGRLAQIRSDFSPLTAWCHLLTPNHFDRIGEIGREANFGGLEASWTGLTIAEALLLSEMPLSRLNLTACLATQTFAIARSHSLWGTTTKDVLQRYDTSHHLFRAKGSRLATLRTVFNPIWQVLSGASGEGKSNHASSLSPLSDAISALQNARAENHPDEALAFANSLSFVAREADILFHLSEMTPEQRVREFDRIVLALGNNATNENLASRHALAMLAGYLSTVAAGGAPSLSLVERHAKRWPELTAWAYILGSVGQRIVWTSSFDGLGRLVIRELMRSFRLDEAPTCDFALDEASVLFDPKLSDPNVHLRIKQSRVVSISLTAGVNVLVSLAEQQVETRTLEAPHKDRQESVDRLISPETVDLVSEVVWQRLKSRIESHIDSVMRGDNRSSEKGRYSKRTSQQSKLPLKKPQDQ